jgi:hypothetical protein
MGFDDPAFFGSGCFQKNLQTAEMCALLPLLP